MGLGVFPHNVSHALVFQTSAQLNKEIQSYPSTKEGY
jgi:hypothetical protein